MQIFCDESGGVDQGLFLVAAIRIDSQRAARMLKTIRMLTGCTASELKGNDLNIDQIETVFSVLARHPEAVAVSIVCRRDDPVGGWAASTLHEHEIWRELIAECCLLLHRSDVVGVMPDGGRYKKATLRAVEAHIAEAVSRRTGLPRIPISCANSAATPGIQIADVIANTVHRSIRRYRDADRCQQILTAAVTSGQLRIATMEVDEHRPALLDGGLL